MEALSPFLQKMHRARGQRGIAAYLISPEEMDELRTASRDSFRMQYEPNPGFLAWLDSDVPTRKLLEDGGQLPFVRFCEFAVFVDPAIQPGGGMFCQLLK